MIAYILAGIIVVGLVAAFVVGNLPDDRAAGITPIMLVVALAAILLGLIYFP